MTWVARTLGTPVTDPQGNSALNTSTSPTPSLGIATTSDVICQNSWPSVGVKELRDLDGGKVGADAREIRS